VCAVRPRSVMLRDFRKAQAGNNPPQFLWPKFNLAPYHRMGDILPPTEPVIQFPQDYEMEPVPVAQPQTMPSAILSAHPLEQLIAPHEPQHVRNFEYLVRWHGRSHASNSRAPYDSVWASPAFEEFVRGSGLTGHVPSQQFQAAHMAQVGAMLRGSQNPGQLPMAEPQSQARALSHYFPMAAAPRPHPAAVARLSEQQPMALSQDNGPPEFSPQPGGSQLMSDAAVEPPLVPSSGARAASPPGVERVLNQVVQRRRSTRARRPASYGDDFET
jgi:hypothetical protein